jgi:7,8-dihydropterin-6-yl-methyl-4-(beta-D-ribofuranosyl)aminobenzene 5'-phosphate synthase
MTALDYLVLSHNHLDHTWGLDPLIRYYTELDLKQCAIPKPVVVAHPEVFVSVTSDDCNEIGCLISEAKLAKHFSIQLSAQPKSITPRLMFLGEIPRRNDFEGSLTFGRKEGADSDDHVIDDSALVYHSRKGLVIITGCSHAGICNIVEYAKEVCGDERVVDIIGGFHLQNPPVRQMEGTLSYFQALNPECVHACHCTDLESKIALSRVVRVKEVGAGLSIKYDE